MRQHIIAVKLRAVPLGVPHLNFLKCSSSRFQFNNLGHEEADTLTKHQLLLIRFQVRNPYKKLVIRSQV